MTNEERLMEAAERALRYFQNQVAGRYTGPSEDILCGQALSRALRLYRGGEDEVAADWTAHDMRQGVTK